MYGHTASSRTVCVARFLGIDWFRALLTALAVVDRMAALLKGRDINAGDTVGVFASNSPEMVVILYALSKLGAISAMINTNLRGMLSNHL